MVLCLIHFFVGGSVSSPAMLPSWAAVWDLFCYIFDLACNVLSSTQAPKALHAHR